MEKLKALASTSISELKSKTQADMTKLSGEVHKAMIASGYADAAACRTVCSVSIGADGKPVVTCSLVCDW